MNLKLDPQPTDGGGADAPESEVIQAVVAAAGQDPTAQPEPKDVKPKPEPTAEKPAVSEPEKVEVEPTPVAVPVDQPKPAAPVDLPALMAEVVKLQGQLAAARQTSEPAKPQAEAPKKVWTPRAVVKEEDVDKLVVGGKDTAEYLNSLLNNLREDFAELTMLYVDQKFQPVEQDRQAKEIEVRTNEFKTKHKDLADWTDVAREQAGILLNDIQSRGQQFPGWDKFYDMIAERTRPIVQAYQKRFAPAGGGNGGAPPPPAPTPQGAVRGAGKAADKNDPAISRIEDKEEQEFIKAVVMGAR